jgi:hypothetical protein
MNSLRSLTKEMGPRADVEFGTRKSLTSRLKGMLASGLLAAAGMLVLTFATSGLAAAQTDPFVGTWKLNTAKSTPARKSETRIVESSPTGMKVSVDRTNADGSNQQFSYTANLDGKAYPITGTAPYGADSIGVTLTTSNALTFTLWRGGKQIGKGTLLVSADGKTATLKSKGVNEKGKAEGSVSIYEKQ